MVRSASGQLLRDNRRQGEPEDQTLLDPAAGPDDTVANRELHVAARTELEARLASIGNRFYVLIYRLLHVHVAVVRAPNRTDVRVARRYVLEGARSEAQRTAARRTADALRLLERRTLLRMVISPNKLFCPRATGLSPACVAKLLGLRVSTVWQAKRRVTAHLHRGGAQEN